MEQTVERQQVSKQASKIHCNYFGSKIQQPLGKKSNWNFKMLNDQVLSGIKTCYKNN